MDDDDDDDDETGREDFTKAMNINWKNCYRLFKMVAG